MKIFKIFINKIKGICPSLSTVGKTAKYTLSVLLIVIGVLGLALAYINPMPYIASVFPIVVNGTVINVTQANVQTILTFLEVNFIYTVAWQDKYRETDKPKFRIGARKRYIQKTFNTSVQTVTGSYIPQDSGSYAIKDVATDEYIVPFSAYTSMSCDEESPYFIQWLNGFYPDRVYKILLKLKYNDGQEQIFDNNFEFKIKR